MRYRGATEPDRRAWVEGAATTEDREPVRPVGRRRGRSRSPTRPRSTRRSRRPRTPAPAWAAATPQERFTVLERVGLELAARADELGELLAREEGKPRAEAVGEVQRARDAVPLLRRARRSASRASTTAASAPAWTSTCSASRSASSGSSRRGTSRSRSPRGRSRRRSRSGARSSASRPELVPASAWALADVLARSGLPPGAFNLVVGPGARRGGAARRRSARPRASRSPARRRSAPASRRRSRRASAATSSRWAARTRSWCSTTPTSTSPSTSPTQGAFFQTGQRCTASSRLIVDRGDPRPVRRGDGRPDRRRSASATPSTTTPRSVPSSSEAQLAQDLEYLRDRRGRGGRARGRRRAARARDRGLLPVARAPGRHHERHAREPRGDLRTDRDGAAGRGPRRGARARERRPSSACRRASCTTSLRHAARFRDGLQAGIVTVNLPTAGVDFHVPFGGTKGPRAARGSRAGTRSSSTRR